MSSRNQPVMNPALEVRSRVRVHNVALYHSTSPDHHIRTHHREQLHQLLIQIKKTCNTIQGNTLVTELSIHKENIKTSLHSCPQFPHQIPVGSCFEYFAGADNNHCDCKCITFWFTE